MDGLTDVLHNRDLTALQRHLFSCQEIIADVGGYVSQFTVDVRGCVLVAIWGIPSAMFRDNTQRALGAAVRVRYHLLQMKMPCSIAVTSGLAYCGCLGHDIRQEYMVVGDPVDVAARLVGRIKNDIVLDAKTHALLTEKAKAVFKPMPAMSVMAGDCREGVMTVLAYAMNLNDANAAVPNTPRGVSVRMQMSFTDIDNDQIDDRLTEALETGSEFDEVKAVPHACKNVLSVALKILNTRKRKFRNRVPFASSEDMNMRSQHGNSGGPLRAMGLVVIEGEMGSGKEEAMVWLKRSCANRAVRVVSVKLTAGDRTVEFRYHIQPNASSKNPLTHSNTPQCAF